MEPSQYPPHCQMMREAMKERDWQQDVIALVMGHSRSTVNAILTGRRKLTARLAVDYGYVLKIAPEDLLREQGAWLLDLARPRMEAKCAAIKLRVAETEARIAGDINAEIESLRRQRAVIDARIQHLTTIQSA